VISTYQAIFFSESQFSWWFVFQEAYCAEKTGEKTRYKLASKFTQSNSVSRSVYAYAIGTIVDRKCKNRSKCYLGVSGANDSSTPGVCVLFVGKLLDTIYLSIDLFWNDISLRYIFMINGLKGCCWQLCTLLFTLHFY